SLTLTNTSAADVLVPADVLTGVFFDVSGNSIWTPVSAVLGSGSLVFYDPDGQPAGGNLGGEWAYLAGINNSLLPGITRGISSSGLGVFGSPNFNGPDLQSPAAVDGLQYGILSAGDNAATGNGGILNSGGLIKNSVLFTLAVSGDLDVSQIRNVAFQYGTSLSEPRLPTVPSSRPDMEPVPEPSTMVLLLGMGLAGAGLHAVRRRKRRS
ncbi:MAG: PEP-CTERM sorting domain-containing protein, partial [Thermoguttaceae bacterium]|nr:PEP-CTERM sorting domain-containing protein [Thermoguttaceae bacterium]